MTQKKGIKHVLQISALAERHFQVLSGEGHFSCLQNSAVLQKPG